MYIIGQYGQPCLPSYPPMNQRLWAWTSPWWVIFGWHVRDQARAQQLVCTLYWEKLAHVIDVHVRQNEINTGSSTTNSSRYLIAIVASISWMIDNELKFSRILHCGPCFKQLPDCWQLIRRCVPFYAHMKLLFSASSARWNTPCHRRFVPDAIQVSLNPCSGSMLLVWKSARTRNIPLMSTIY